MPRSESTAIVDKAACLRLQIADARDAILEQRLLQPSVGIILGSGLGDLAQHVKHATVIEYTTIPHFCRTHAAGHAGKLVLGYLAGMPIVLMQGRGHRYEGLTNQQIQFPVYCMHALGARALFATNAAGGLNPRYRKGELMVIDSHLDFLWSRGQVEPMTGSIRASMSHTPPYDWSLIEQAQIIARRSGTVLHQGTYLATLGPSYETRSEYRLFRWAGADAVGMSTIPEVLAAQELNMRVLALSVITNVASTDVPQATTHAEVVDAGCAAGPRLLGIVHQILEDMAGQPD